MKTAFDTDEGLLAIALEVYIEHLRGYGFGPESDKLLERSLVLQSKLRAGDHVLTEVDRFDVAGR